MRSIYELIIILVVGLTWLFVYQYYWDDVKTFFFSGEPTYVVHINDVALEVTVADDTEERIQGLSGVESLRDFEGKLFIFDEADQHGIWMKDMIIPIDILWLDNKLRVVHIERNVMPSTYPDTFSPDEPTRFVLETKAHFVDSLKIKVGDRLIVPPGLLPRDVRDNLQK